MNRYTIPIVFGLFCSPLLAQSAIVVQQSGPGAGGQTLSGAYRVMRLSPSGQWTLQRQTPGQGSAIIVRTPGQKRAGQAQDVQDPRQGDPWIGLSLRARTDGPKRLEVAEVLPDSPAERAGVQAGDKLVALGGRTVSEHKDLLEVLEKHHAGDHLMLSVERVLKPRLGKLDDAAGHAYLGVNSADARNSQAERRGGSMGPSVTKVLGDSSAESTGLRAGDRVAAVDGVEVSTTKELQDAVRSHRPGDEVELRIQRDLQVELAEQPGSRAPGRAVAGTGPRAFEAPGQPPAGSDPRLFAPKAGEGFFWTQPDAPTAPGQDRRDPRQPPPNQAGPQGPKARVGDHPGPRAGQAPTPGPRARAGRATRDPRRDATPAPQGGQAQVTSELLEELRALRAEVADLRREIDALRLKQRR